MSHPSSAGAPIGLPPGTPPYGSHGAPALGGQALGNGGYALPAGAAGPASVAAPSAVPYAGPLFGPPDPAQDAPPPPPAVPVGRTYRDLPPDPPYGPVQPYREPLPPRPTSGQEDVPGETSRITPLQIALGVGGIVLLLAIGVGAALFLLRDGGDQDLAASPLQAETEQDGDPFGQFTPSPLQPQPDPGPSTQPDAPQGELTPVPAPSAQPDAGQPEPTPAPDGGTDPDAATPADPGADPTPDAGAAPDAGQTPDAGTGPQAPTVPQVPGAPAPDPQAGDVELPLLFELSQLPRDTSEADTTVTQTSAADNDATLEQVTRLDNPDGQITVRALRAADAADRFEALTGDTAREVTVRGVPALVLEGQRLIWLVPGDVDTFLEVDAPATLGTDELLTIANGLELNP